MRAKEHLEWREETGWKSRVKWNVHGHENWAWTATNSWTKRASDDREGSRQQERGTRSIVRRIEVPEVEDYA